jgi:hypothetical protein
MFLQNFWPKLKAHLLDRILAERAPVAPNTASCSRSSSGEGGSQESDKLFFKKECMYQHNIMRINYTTYDARRAQDIVNPNTDHRDIMMLSSKDVHSWDHEFCYARVLGIYHINVIYLESDKLDYRSHRMEFLWVQWFKLAHELSSRASWVKRQLDVLELVPTRDPDAFGFVDPANVLRGCHIIPRFSGGMQDQDGKEMSQPSRDLNGWSQYFVGR